ncbi:MAG: trimethylamine methyltransferase family protein, partial [Candidatus Methylomirabilales bacterium]
MSRRRRSRQRVQQASVAPGGLETRSFAPLSQSDIERIHDASLRVLDRTGIEIVASEARRIFEKAGARIEEDRNRVYVSRSLVEDAVAQSAKTFLLAGQDEAHDMQMGGDRVYMGTGGAAVKVLDLEGHVRQGRLEDVALLARLVDALDNIHFYLRPVVAQDIPNEHLDINKTYASVANTSKHVMTQAFTADSAREIIEMVS